MAALELVGKRLELLKDAVPEISYVAVLADPAHAGEQRELQETQSTARNLGITLRYHRLTATADINPVLDTVTKYHTDALLVFPDSVTLEHSKRIAHFALSRSTHLIPNAAEW